MAAGRVVLVSTPDHAEYLRVANALRAEGVSFHDASNPGAGRWEIEVSILEAPRAKAVLEAGPSKRVLPAVLAAAAVLVAIAVLALAKR